MKEKEKESTEQQLYVTGLLFLRIKIRFVDSHLLHFSLILIYALDTFLLKNYCSQRKHNHIVIYYFLS
jgi:hypothetical protein